MTSRATSADDPALAETSWPMPENHLVDQDSLEWKLRYAPSRLTKVEAYEVADMLQAYRALIVYGQTKQQLLRLAALRRVYRRTK